MLNAPEILSPAGSMDALIAAVRAGADAVYLGATAFSARRNAQNFDRDGLVQAVEYCHIRGVKVYLTLNITLRDRELSAGIEVARAAVDAGIDGVIVQDLGLCRLLRQAFPTLPLHASTQMSVHTPAALELLKTFGISRVVAAREMRGEELRALCTAAARHGMTVEVFVHGALCMCVSGQCLLSSMLGGRSGNRGLCAGPCRLPFAAENGTGYDLSLKDLSLLPHLQTLAQMGVASFKIEGRMKRPEYVAAATAAARSMLDTGTVRAELLEALTDVFSRSGFTDGYFTGRTGREMFGVRTKEDVTAARRVYPMLHEFYRTDRQNVPISGTVTLCENQPIALTLTDGVHTVTATGDIPQTANAAGLNRETVQTALEKLGGTPYILESLKIQLSPGLYLRGADLNALRRNAVAELSQQRKAAEKRPQQPVSLLWDDRSRPSAPAIYIRVASQAQLPQSLKGVAAVLYPLEAELPKTLPEKVRLIADVPRGIISEDFLADRLRTFRAKGFKAAYCGNLSAVRIAQKCGMEVLGGVGLNVTNAAAAEVLRDWGLCGTVLSPELTLAAAKKLPTRLNKGLFAYGRLPLMLTKNCPIANGKTCGECDRRGVLTDRLGVQFPVRCRAGFAEVLNSLPIYLGDCDIGGFDFLLLSFTTESAAAVEQVLAAYAQHRPAWGEYTRGHYFEALP